MKSVLVLTLNLLLFAGSTVAFAQVDVREIRYLDSLIETGNSGKVIKEIKAEVASLFQTDASHRVSDYLEVLGRALIAADGITRAEQEMDGIIVSWAESLEAPYPKRLLYMKAASWYEYLGNSESAYQAELMAYDWARKEAGVSAKILGKLKVNLGAYSINRMDLESAKDHFGEALQYLAQDPDPESVYLTNSYLGNLSYFSSKLDSAEYYFLRCLEAISELEPTPRNKFYRPAIISNNLSGVQAALGKTSESIASMNNTISNLSAYIEVLFDPSEKNKAKEFYFQALDNLGGIYKEVRNYQKAKGLLEFSHNQKLQTFGPKSKETVNSKILLGQLYLEMLEIDHARSSLEDGLKGLEGISGEREIWEADARYALARVDDYSGDEDKAMENYRLADLLYQKVLEGEFDPIYLGFLTSYSKFLAESGQSEFAEKTALRSIQYLHSIGNYQSLLLFNQTTSLADVYYTLGEYQKALITSESALTILTDPLKFSKTPQDSIQLELKRPQALLLKIKSAYALEKNKTAEFLVSLLPPLREGLDVLERRKKLLETDEDVRLLIEENQEYFRFLEKINLELFKKTGKEEYVMALLSFHESALYQKIRARLEQNESVRFGTIPEKILADEKMLKSRLSGSLHQEGVADYLLASQDWNDFMLNLKRTYPAYYDFRYASLERSFDRIQDYIPSEISVVRYLFADDRLTAIVMDKDHLQLVELDFESIRKTLESIHTGWYSLEESSKSMKVLYDALWRPLAPYISYERVMIIPDGPLFNLSFDVLTEERIMSYKEMGQKSLLAKHSISYHYSSLLFDYPAQNNTYLSNLVAFAPGFSDEMKGDYLGLIKDSLQIDQGYLRLLPQPFTQQLVAAISKTLGGNSFLEKESTLSKFNTEAGKHQIIHIGTHAESNNINPQFSRLIFAKASDEPWEENALYAKDIYSLDLSSELAVLIACESGKPSYSPGEGMVSLAHAFNFAGSKSMLMGIWKIDEKASALIVGDFYSLLADGLSKDQALRQAKLNYLEVAESRALAPNFWAGLIVMGDPKALDLDPVFNLRLIWLVIFPVLIVIILVIRARKPRIASRL